MSLREPQLTSSDEIKNWTNLLGPKTQELGFNMALSLPKIKPPLANTTMVMPQTFSIVSKTSHEFLASTTVTTQYSIGNGFFSVTVRDSWWKCLISVDPTRIILLVIVCYIVKKKCDYPGQ